MEALDTFDEEIKSLIKKSGKGKKYPKSAIEAARRFLSRYTNVSSDQHKKIIKNALQDAMDKDSFDGNDQLDSKDFGRRVVLQCTKEGIVIKRVPKDVEEAIQDSFNGTGKKLSKKTAMDMWHVVDMQHDLSEDDKYDAFTSALEDAQEFSSLNGSDEFDNFLFGKHVVKKITDIRGENLDDDMDDTINFQGAETLLVEMDGYHGTEYIMTNNDYEQDPYDEIFGLNKKGRARRQERRTEKRQRRQDKKLQRISNRGERKALRRSLKQERKAGKVAARLDRKMMKTQGRADRKAVRKGQTPGQMAEAGISEAKAGVINNQIQSGQTPAPSPEALEAGQMLGGQSMAGAGQGGQESAPAPSMGGGGGGGGGDMGGGGYSDESYSEESYPEEEYSEEEYSDEDYSEGDYEDADADAEEVEAEEIPYEEGEDSFDGGNDNTMKIVAVVAIIAVIVYFVYFRKK